MIILGKYTHERLNSLIVEYQLHIYYKTLTSVPQAFTIPG